jgi:hypothetical protein
MPSIIAAMSVNRYTSNGRFGALPMIAMGRKRQFVSAAANGRNPRSEPVIGGKQGNGGNWAVNCPSADWLSSSRRGQPPLRI